MPSCTFNIPHPNNQKQRIEKPESKQNCSRIQHIHLDISTNSFWKFKKKKIPSNRTQHVSITTLKNIGIPLTLDRYHKELFRKQTKKKGKKVSCPLNSTNRSRDFRFCCREYMLFLLYVLWIIGVSYGDPNVPSR